MASGKTYRQKGDLRALNVMAEATYGVPTASASVYAGTLDTMTPKDSETVTYVPDEGSRGVGTPYRTAEDFGFDAKFSFASSASTTSSRTDGWERWLALAVGASNSSIRTGLNAKPTSFTAWFKTSSTEGHIYEGAVIDKLVISASE